MANASASHPKPSTAPALESDSEYSPISLPPQAETVDSSSTSSDGSSDLPWGVQNLPVMAALTKLMEQSELTPTQTARFWRDDEMSQNHAMFCPSWIELVKNHSCIFSLNGAPQTSQPGKLMKFLHTSYKTVEGMLSKGCLGQRYLFGSPMAAALHRVTHHHFGLSQAKIGQSGMLVLGILIDEDFICTEGQAALNGYSHSVNIKIDSIENAKVELVSSIQISPSIVEALLSDEIIALTRKSISHFEAIMEVAKLDEVNMVSPEVLTALSIPTPWSAKFRCTLAMQTPKLYERMVELIRVIKGQGACEDGNKNRDVEVTTSASGSSTIIEIKSLAADAEVSVKKASDPKSDLSGRADHHDVSLQRHLKS
eukprot:3947249-Amphidinium_carterae.1